MDDFDAEYFAMCKAQANGESYTPPAPVPAPAPAPAPAEPADKPVFLEPGLEAKTNTQQELEEALKRGPVRLSDFMNIKIERTEPTLGRIVGEDRRAFYRNKSNAISGEPGKGKSLAAKRLLLEEAALGIACLYIDYEKDFPLFVERMINQGVTTEQAKYIGYWNPTQPLEGGVMATVLRHVKEYGVDLVIIDSVSRAMARAGLDENDNNAVRRWYDSSCDLLIRAGATPILVDHLKKPEESNGRPIQSNGRGAKGGIAKLEVITGINLILKTVKVFSRQQAGYVTAVCTKDNNGAWSEGEIVFEMHVRPTADGGIDIEFIKSASQTKDETGQTRFRPTNLMEKVSALLEEQGPLNMAKLKAGIQSAPAHVVAAVDALVAGGYVEAPDPAPGKSRIVTHTKRFREATDPLKVKPTTVDDLLEAQGGPR